jgi:CHASE3 domain sensor protein
MARKSKPNRTRSKQASGTRRYILDGLVGLARPMVNSEKEWMVERMSELANASQEYATSLDETPNLASYISTAAESLQEFADYVNENEFDKILKDSTEYARRHPVAVIIGGAIAGLVVTQMLRSNEFGARSGSRLRKTSSRSRRARGGRSHGNGRSSEESTRLNS